MTPQKIDERFLQSIDEGLPKGPHRGPQGCLRRAAQACRTLRSRSWRSQHWSSVLTRQ
jgi:hypothetical protein